MVFYVLLGVAEESKDDFSLFARAYPFLVMKSTKSIKAAIIPSYPAEVPLCLWLQLTCMSVT